MQVLCEVERGTMGLGALLVSRQTSSTGVAGATEQELYQQLPSTKAADLGPSEKATYWTRAKGKAAEQQLHLNHEATSESVEVAAQWHHCGAAPRPSAPQNPHFACEATVANSAKREQLV